MVNCTGCSWCGRKIWGFLKHVGCARRTCENQKVLCPLLQMLVPLVHGAFLASILPIGGCFPPEKAGVSESMELRAGGMIMLEWPCTVLARAATSVLARTIGIHIPVPDDCVHYRHASGL